MAMERMSKMKDDSKGMDKATFFKYYVQIGFVCLGAAILLVVLIQDPVDWTLIFTILGGFLSYIYFVQKQKVEEIRFFKELFTECNERYDQMNERLNRIFNGDSSKNLTEEEKNYLYDYFNLGGEEYLYYKQGYIIPEAWEAWKNGMCYFYRNERIRNIWQKELDDNSYYGFTLSLLA